MVQFGAGRIKFIRLSIIILVLLPGLLFLQFFTGQAAVGASSLTEFTTSENETSQVDFHPALEISHSSASAAIVETGRLRLLYDKNANERQSIPAASKIMTALIACERLPLDTPVTISTVAAATAAGKTTPDGVRLRSGDKYPLEYLLLRLIFYNSDGAAVAIAEQIANVEEDFVELMNAKAASAGLTDTVFMNSTGKPVYFDSVTGVDNGLTENADLQQYTTPADLARLVAAAMANGDFAMILQKQSDYLVLDGSTLVAMENHLSDLWTLSEDMITGAFYCEWSGKSFMVAVGKVKGIGVAAVTAAGSPGSREADLLALFNAFSDYYVLSPLVVAGERFSDITETTIDGEKFGLLYNKTVNYVHPAGDSFLKQKTQYISFGPFSRPIQRSMTAGQVIFELLDGTTIAVDVNPDQQILSSITVLDKVLEKLQGNKNLTVVIFTTIGFLLLVMLVNLISSIRKLSHLIRLIRLEKRSRR